MVSATATVATRYRPLVRNEPLAVDDIPGVRDTETPWPRTFATLLAASQQRSLLCVGLDPDPARLPASVRRAKSPLFAFNREIVDATAAFAGAFKPQIAHYAAVGAERELEQTIAYIRHRHPRVPVILDAKRGDIADTAEFYAREVFDRYAADAVTVNPYLGGDALAPFLARADRGVFVLCRTSNAGSGEVQAWSGGGDDGHAHGDGGVRDVGGDYAHADGGVGGGYGDAAHARDHSVAERVATLAATRWNANRNVGLVVGATWLAELKAIRARAGALPLLIPGVGAQGGDLPAVLTAALTDTGDDADTDNTGGVLINVSRAIIHAADGASDDNGVGGGSADGGDPHPDFAHAAARAAEHYAHTINRHRRR